MSTYINQALLEIFMEDDRKVEEFRLCEDFPEK